MFNLNQIRLLALSTVLGACVSSASAQKTFVNATSGAAGNTTLANGGLFSPPLNGTTGADQLWEERTTFASGGNVFESQGESAGENAPRLAVNLSLANGTYNIYAYFWSPGTETADNQQQWLLRAGLQNTAEELQLYSRVLGVVTTPVNEPGMQIATQVTSGDGFDVAPTLFTENSRNLWEAYLGQAVVNNGTLQVFIDDYSPATTVNNRTWFDGVGFSVVPEPSSIALFGLGLAGMLARRRK
ncbi:MAG TPA: PEP-CTERM sorting domain-containing protein [Verrucomicrobiae bacterium]|nr:PEP-CTERM sorting domain-containing protein [Verrucomicrobiae bacterium]